MLRELKDGETWTVDEMKVEQLYFMKHDGKPSQIVHARTDTPYIAEELARYIFEKELARFRELEEENKSLKLQANIENPNFVQVNTRTCKDGKAGRPRELSDEQIEKIKRMKADGFEGKKIAEKMGVSDRTIRRYW